jgi:hypothetical protein
MFELIVGIVLFFLSASTYEVVMYIYRALYKAIKKDTLDKIEIVIHSELK